MLAYLRAQPLKLTITSNGHSIEVLDDADVTAFKDVEFSLDYPTRDEQDAQRGPGNWDLLHQQAARCRRLGVPVTFIAVMMRANFDRLAEIAQIAKTYDAPLRINVYQAVRSDAYRAHLRGVLDRLRDALRQDGRDRDRRAAGARHGRHAAAPGRVRRRDRARHAPRAPCSPASTGPAAARRSTCSSTSEPISSRRLRSRPRAPCPRRAWAAPSARPAPAAAPGAGVSWTRSISRIPIARSCAATIAASRSAWRRRASCRSSRAPARRS